MTLQPRFRWSAAMIKVVAYGLFYSGLLALFNRFVNRFEIQRSIGTEPTFPFVQRRTRRNVQILTYHRVNDEYDPFFPAVPSPVFARQMEYLADYFRVCSLGEAVERLQSGDIPENLLVITFDDGYHDNYLHAFPILKKFSLPATVFLATEAIGSRKCLWHDQVFSAFRETTEPCLRGYGRDMPDYPLKTQQERLYAQLAVLQFLRSVDNDEREGWINRLATVLGTERSEKKSRLMLNWDEVRIMHKQGIAFGSHTLTHPILSKLSPEKIMREICQPKKVIKQHLGVEPNTFAYPNGSSNDFTPQIKRTIQDAGYTCAVTTIFGVNTPGQDLFELRRGGPWETHLPTFATKLNWYKLASS